MGMRNIYDTIITKTDDLTQTLAQLPKEELDGWLAYLGEAIEKDLGIEKLAELNVIIAERISVGNW
jgi:hypothetical protein